MNSTCCGSLNQVDFGGGAPFCFSPAPSPIGFDGFGVIIPGHPVCGTKQPPHTNSTPCSTTTDTTTTTPATTPTSTPATPQPTTTPAKTTTTTATTTTPPTQSKHTQAPNGDGLSVVIGLRSDHFVKLLKDSELFSFCFVCE